MSINRQNKFSMYIFLSMAKFVLKMSKGRKITHKKVMDFFALKKLAKRNGNNIFK